MNPNFLIERTAMNTMMAEDCSVPALRNPGNYEVRRRGGHVRKPSISIESNEQFLRMLCGR